MPDSQVPPIWGPAYDERDLDALLSGETGSTPVALQPVEGTLAALRGAATRRELADEAVARAAFRAFVPVSPTTGPLPWAAEAEPAAVTSHTLVLPPADHRQQPAARHRHRRRTAKSARKPRIAVTGAAALIVVATAVTGALTGSIGELTSFGRQPASSSASARATGQSPASEGVQVTGAARDRISTPKTTASAPPASRPTPDPRSLCREYFGDFGHPGQDAGAAWIALNGQLSTLAGGPGPAKIFSYCLHALGPLAGKGGWPPPVGVPAGGDGAPGRANPASGNLGAASQGSQPSGTSGGGQSADPGVSVDNP